MGAPRAACCCNPAAPRPPPSPRRSPRRITAALVTATMLLFLLAYLDSSCAEPVFSPNVPLKNSSQASACSQPFETGPCSGWVTKWWYDAHQEQCQTFVYGGCPGNDNRFDSLAECEYHCLPGDHTLPPYLSRHNPFAPPPSDAPSDVITTTTTRAPPPPPLRGTAAPLPPVPPEQRGEHLTLLESGHHQAFTFARANGFIQLDGDTSAAFQPGYSREIRLHFRTRQPHGLLLYQGLKERPQNMPPYALYVLIQRGQLRIKHVIGENATVFNVGKGLNRDRWHEVRVHLDMEKGMLHASVDQYQESMAIQGINEMPELESDSTDSNTVVPSVIFVGGLSPEERLIGVKRLINSFLGCIKDVSLSWKRGATDEMHVIKPLMTGRHGNVEEGCNNRCRTRHNLCFQGSHCINHYSHYTCDCFGTHYEGEHCDFYTATVLTMRGYSYLSYRVYDWKDRVHSSENRLSILFKTNFDDSTLFYAAGESHKQHHVVVSILNKTVHVEMDFGSGALNFVLGETFGVTGNHWHNLTLSHRGTHVIASLDREKQEFEVPGDHHHLYLDPEICVGGGPPSQPRPAGASQNNFVGSLKYAYFNDVNLLYELSKGSPRAQYVSVLPPDFSETEVQILPITFPFPASHLLWPLKRGEPLNLKFDFKSSKAMAVLAFGNVTSEKGHGYWEIRVVNEEIRFELVPLASENITIVSTVRFDPRGSWHNVELQYGPEDDVLSLIVDYRHRSVESLGLQQFTLGDHIMIASSIRRNTGLVGCLRAIVVSGVPLEARSVVRSNRAIGQVSLDNCELVDPCSRPDACKHGGRCSVNNDRVVCDCKGTGYTGKNCHFAEFRKTCEELALLGFTEPDVYLIDIDGNGRFPPAHVECEFQAEETKTIVKHNLPSQVDVRSVQYENFRFDIQYREFSAEMLQELISHSLYCSQYIKYDCYKAPLHLHSATWFVSSAKTQVIDHIGESPPGLCPCGVNHTCVAASSPCHCDAGEAKWHADEAFFTSPRSLGITEMVFLQQSFLESDAQGRMTLGPLECVEANTQKYVVTFTSSQSYIEVPGWRTGDIAFSFRTTGERAILLHQPPIRHGHPCFTVVLSDDFELTFSFVLSDGSMREMKIPSDRRLNGGDWQKIWIDYNEHHVRFMINTKSQMVDLQPGERFGPFEGSMFIGGAPDSFRELLPDPNIREGLIGCFRGLVVNGEILDIYSYISVHLSEIIKDCKPSCDPNPCQNEATCKEHWSSFECVCVNPWAHLGHHCEIDINEEGLTFRDEEAFVKSMLLPSEATESEWRDMQLVLEENILLNVRTHQQKALLLYANDHLNNFVHVHIEGGDTVVFAFNSGPNIEVLRAKHPGLSDGGSVQIAIIRGLHATTLHVENTTISTTAPFQLLTKYSNKPWVNPNEEILSPQRTPVPPTEYFQISLGGYDTEDFLDQPLPGFVGCLRGLRVAHRNLLQLLRNPEGLDGKKVSQGCHMKCDEKPCQNQGVCTEDFSKGESTCNCTHTSYFGPNCAEEKGAFFSGDAYLHRPLLSSQLPESLWAQLAFSTKNVSPVRDSKSILLYIDRDPDLYFIVALTGNGGLEIEESLPYGKWHAEIVNVTNNARHSVLYRRQGRSATLWVDRKLADMTFTKHVVSLEQYDDLGAVNNSINDTGLEEAPMNAATIYVGGWRDDENADNFAYYRNYSGCISNILVEVQGDSARPLEEYMGFTRNRTENVRVIGVNSAGVKSGFCAHFGSALAQFTAGPLPNVSMLATDVQWKDKTWVEDPPARIPYVSPNIDSGEVEESNSNVVLIALALVFVAIVIGCIIELVRNNRQYKRRRRQEQEMWVMGAPPKYPDSILTNSQSNVKMTGFKPIANDKIKPAMNGTELQPLTRSEPAHIVAAVPLARPHSPLDKADSPVTEPVESPEPGSITPEDSPEHEKQDKSDEELRWDPMGEGSELLGGGSLDNLSGALGRSMDELEDEEEVNDPEDEVSTNLTLLAPLSTISEVTLNYGSTLTMDEDDDY